MTSKTFAFAVSTLLASTQGIVWAQQTSLENTRPTVADARPMELDWKSFVWPSINYSRISVDGGGALYLLPSDSLKFRLDFVFDKDIFSLPQKDITAVSAMAEVLLLGGNAKMNYDQIQKVLSQNGISMKSTITDQGQFELSVEGLSDDFPLAFSLLSDTLFSPKFEQQALDLWKNKEKQSFQSLLEANTISKQTAFVDYQSNILAFGKDHYFSRLFEKNSPKAIDDVQLDSIKSLYQQIINRNGLNVFLSGSYTADARIPVRNMIFKIPRHAPAIKTWYPGRTLLSEQTKIRMAVIHKKDMTQSNISLKFYFPNLGELNGIEKTQVAILQEIFSASGGVIGNDRFSKALRSETGLSYYPSASINLNTVAPNTNLADIQLQFQSPNERLHESIQLALKTWETFVHQGISQEELDKARISMMNSLLGTEWTVFDKIDYVEKKLNQNEEPKVNPIEVSLLKLDALKDANQINCFLKSLNGSAAVPVLVIMGNPDKNQMDLIKSIPNTELIYDIDFMALAKSMEGNEDPEKKAPR